MKKAIAMKCTQEQFDTVKDKLVRIEITSITDFNESNYLTNGYKIGIITNLDKYYVSIWTENIHETWNEEIFLNACGIETERIFKGSELQYLNKDSDEWKDLVNPNIELRIKPANLIKKQELESKILDLQNQLKNL